MTVTFGTRKIGDGHPCFITFEAGATHNGLEMAKKMVTLAAEVGGDAVKFQILDPDRLVADRKLPFTYDVLVDRETGKTETVSEPLYDILCRRALSHREWKELKKHADACGIAFFATIGFEDEVKLVEEMQCASIKIASADVTHFPLIKLAAKTGLNIQLDTGNSTLGEIEEAVDVIKAQGNESIIIHQCPSGYPARIESVNLNIIKTLKSMFPYPVAYSDHVPGWEMDIAAISVGANMVEKTITLDRTTRSVEHIMSLEPAEMKAFVQALRDVETAMGSRRRIMTPEEKEKKIRYRRSIYTAQAVKKGQALGAVKVEFRRPGYGIQPNRYEELLGHVFTRDFPAGHQVAFTDLEKTGQASCAA